MIQGGNKMNQLIRNTLLCAALSSVMPLAHAQVYPEGNGIVFSGITQFDLYVDVSHWHGMADDPVAFRLAAQRQLEAALTDIGATRRPASRNHLVCRLQARLDGDQVSYASTMELWGLQSTEVHTLLWRQGDIIRTAQSDFSAARIAADCAGHFEAEWSKWNSPTRNGWQAGS